MYTPLKVFSQDTKEPIVLRINQNCAGLTHVIVSKRQPTGARVSATATVLHAWTAEEPYTDLTRDWEAGEMPAAGGDMVLEAVVTWPGSPTKDRTFPGADQRPLLVQILPRLTTADA